LGIPGGVTERLSELHHALGQCIIGDNKTGPYGLEKFIARHHLATGCSETFQHRHGLGMDMHDIATALDTFAAWSDGPIPQSKISPHGW
jgi:hypothetical protein